LLRGVFPSDKLVGQYQAPAESGAKQRETGFARSGNARVPRGMIQLAWRFLWLQKDSGLAEWYRQRAQAAPATRKTLIVAPARRLLIALWRLAHDGIVPEGVQMRPA
jgi:transposase